MQGRYNLLAVLLLGIYAPCNRGGSRNLQRGGGAGRAQLVKLAWRSQAELGGFGRMPPRIFLAI